MFTVILIYVLFAYLAILVPQQTKLLAAIALVLTILAAVGIPLGVR